MFAEAPRAGVAGLVALGGGLIIGAELADLVDRKIAGMAPPDPKATTQPKLPDGIATVDEYNDLAVSAKPTAGRIFAQLGVAAAGFILGAVVPWPIVRLGFYGLGFGAIAHLGVQLINAWIVEPMLIGTDSQKEMFGHETKANNKINPATCATGKTLQPDGSCAGPPAEQTRRPLPQTQPAARIPDALASLAFATPERALGQPAAPGMAGLGNQQQQRVQVAQQRRDPPPPPAVCQGGGCAAGCGCTKCSKNAQPPAPADMGAPPPARINERHPLLRANRQSFTQNRLAPRAA